MKIKYTITFVVLFCFTWSLKAITSGTDTLLQFIFNGHSYTVVNNNKTWANAASDAKAKGGYLAQIESDSESQAIWQHIQLMHLNTSNTTAPDGGGASYLWIGGTDKVTEGTWKWDGENNGTGTTFFQGKYPTGTAQNNSFINWGNEPDDYGNSQDGLGLALTDWPLGTAGHWNDIDVNNTLYFLIEFNNLQGTQDDLKSENYTIRYQAEHSRLSITCAISDTYQVRILDIQGRQLKTETFSGSHREIKLNDFSSGNYFVTVESTNGHQQFTQKINIVR